MRKPCKRQMLFKQFSLDAKAEEEKTPYCDKCKKYHFSCKHKNPMDQPKVSNSMPLTWSRSRMEKAY